MTDSSGATDPAAANVAVRHPGREDLPAIMEISNQAIRETTAIFRSQPDTLAYWVDLWESQANQYAWFVAEHQGAVVGFAKASPFIGRCGYAFTAEVTIYVGPAHHGKGVGRALYSQLIPRLKAQGYQTLVAVIAIPNPGSVRLHERFGFRKVGLLSRVGWKFDQWHDVAYWQLQLQDVDPSPDPIKSVQEVAGLEAEASRASENVCTKEATNEH